MKYSKLYEDSCRQFKLVMLKVRVSSCVSILVKFKQRMRLHVKTETLIQSLRRRPCFQRRCSRTHVNIFLEIVVLMLLQLNVTPTLNVFNTVLKQRVQLLLEQVTAFCQDLRI